MKAEERHKFLSEIDKYYSSRLAQHGATPRGVDWNEEASQRLRFEQLSKLFTNKNFFSVNDLGCGYGAFFDFLNETYKSVSYLGIDVSTDMIREAERRHSRAGNARFVVGTEPFQIADYGAASGIFNVRLKKSDEEWSSYLETTLDSFDRTSRLGFAFNCLTTYADSEKMRGYLYYANPGFLFDLCKARYSRNVALLHDYGLYEFTILVRKMP